MRLQSSYRLSHSPSRNAVGVPIFMNSTIAQKFMIPRFGVGLLLSCSAVFAATAPYMENFNDGVANGFLTAGTTGAYGIQAESGGYSYRSSLSASSSAQSASAGVSISNVAGVSCVVTTDFEITSLTASGSSVALAGLGLFSNTQDFSSATAYRLYYETNGTSGSLRLVKGSVTMATSSGLAPRLNVKYTLSAVVTYYGGAVTIQGVLYDDTNTIGVTSFDTQPLTGSYFGYRTAINTAGVPTAITIRYDNFEVLLDSGAAPVDATIPGDLLVGGSVAISGNTFTLGESGATYAASLVYNPATADFGSELTSGTGTWSWRRGAVLGMSIDAQNRLALIGADGATPGVYLNPRGLSEIKALHVKEDLSVGGSLRIAPQGDLLMGGFDAGTDPSAP
jgi:hypothetical protein